MKIQSITALPSFGTMFFLNIFIILRIEKTDSQASNNMQQSAFWCGFQALQCEKMASTNAIMSTQDKPPEHVTQCRGFDLKR